MLHKCSTIAQLQHTASIWIFFVDLHETLDEGLVGGKNLKKNQLKKIAAAPAAYYCILAAYERKMQHIIS